MSNFSEHCFLLGAKPFQEHSNETIIHSTTVTTSNTHQLRRAVLKIVAYMRSTKLPDLKAGIIIRYFCIDLVILSVKGKFSIL